jgi:hypothetical protein
MHTKVERGAGRGLVAAVIGAVAMLLVAPGCARVVIDGGDDSSLSPGQTGQEDPGVVSVPACGGDGELQLIGVYETSSDHSSGYHPTGAATVHVERQGKQILALSSYEPVHWTVTAAPGAVLEKVILNGYYDQEADVPDGVPVEVHAGPEGSLGGYAYAWPSAEGGSDTQALVKALEGLTGRKLTSFNGCYRAQSFVLTESLAATASCAVDEGYELSSHVSSDCKN